MMKSKSDILTVDDSLQWRAAPLLQRMSVVVIDDFDILEDYIEAWEDLSVEALEPNPFYEPWMLIPALRGLAAGKDLCVVLVLTVNEGEPVLCGVFPLEKKQRYKKLPVAAFSLWRHIYSPLCTPLIRTSYARACMDVFLDWLASERECALMDFNLVSGDGPFNQLLNECLTAREASSVEGDSHERAILRPKENADLYLRAAYSREHRKDLRRKGRRLSELGQLEFNSLELGGDIDTWIEDFLQLEASGWKGNGGGAFACSEANRDYFVSIAQAAFARGRLTMFALRLDGKPIAMKCNFISEPGSFAFKIAFDENYSAYSPGVLLEIENISRFHAQRQVEWMDSCAVPEHPMINRLWPDRRAIKSVLIPTGKKAGDLVISALPFMRSLNRKIRSLQVRG
jgi:CelD/BcsL family acetyltransferase involved in cellulose biosynthesis